MKKILTLVLCSTIFSIASADESQFWLQNDTKPGSRPLKLTVETNRTDSNYQDTMVIYSNRMTKNAPYTSSLTFYNDPFETFNVEVAIYNGPNEIFKNIYLNPAVERNQLYCVCEKVDGCSDVLLQKGAPGAHAARAKLCA